MADLPRGFRTTQNLKRFSYGPQPVSAPAIAYSGTWAPLNSPHFTGDPQAPTPSPGDNDTSIATTAFVTAAATAAPNKPITLSGDIGGTGTSSIPTTLPNINSNVGTFQGLTVNAKGQVTAAANQGYLTGITSGQVTTALGYTPLRPSNNLSDVANTATALANLGGLPIAGGTITGSLTINGTLAVGGNANPSLALFSAGAYTALYAPDGTTSSNGIFQGNTAGTGGVTLYRHVSHQFQDATGANGFCTMAVGGTTFGNPTGGAKGAGTINAVQVYGAGVLLTSDARLKRDVEALPDRCLDLVAAIEPKSFRWEPPKVLRQMVSLDTGEPEQLSLEQLGPPGFWDRRNWGFLAQDVAAAMTARGHDFGGHIEDRDGLQSLSYFDLLAVLWKAVHELRTRVVELEAKCSGSS